MLIFKIQKRLSDLSTSQLQTVVSLIADGQETYDAEELSEPELYDLIVKYIRSEKLEDMEDEGMSQLLQLHDLVSDLSLVLDTDAGAPHFMDDSQTHQPENDPPTSKGDIHTLANTFREDGDTRAPARDVTPPMKAKSSFTSTGGAPLGRTSSSSTITDQVVRLTEVAALLPRRECKLHGGQISDAGSEISYNSLCKQIDAGLNEGFSGSEIIRAVLKIIKPGTFREMLTNRDDLSVDGLKKFLRCHMRDKNVTELFQELNNVRQQDKESPQQFLYRLMGLKQRVLFESKQPGADFSYDKKLVQGTFLHTLYQGLNERNGHVRCDLKPFLSDMQVSDDFLLEQIIKSTTEEEGRLRRLGTVTKTRPVTVNAAQHDSNEQSDQTKQTNVDSELKANRDAIKELTAQVFTLTQHLAQRAKPTENVKFKGPGSPTIGPQAPVTETRGRCHDCVQEGSVSCPHCFICGQVGHRAIGCLQKKMSGNGKRSLERGSPRS